MKTFAYLVTEPRPKISKTETIVSSHNKKIEGFIMVIGRPPFEAKDKEITTIDMVVSAAELAAGEGADILGLGEGVSGFYDKAYSATKNMKLPVTSGAALEAWTVFESVHRMARLKKISLKDQVLAVIDADCAPGSLCSRRFAGEVAKVVLNSAEPARLKRIEEEIGHLAEVEVVIEPDVSKAIAQADIVILCDAQSLSSSLPAAKKGALVCGIPADSGANEELAQRRDITFFQAGLIKMPNPVRFGFAAGLPEGVIPAPLAETMLLTFEEKFVNYSTGDNINLDKMDEIADIAAKHGFEVWLPQAPVL